MDLYVKACIVCNNAAQNKFDYQSESTAPHSFDSITEFQKIEIDHQSGISRLIKNTNIVKFILLKYLM